MIELSSENVPSGWTRGDFILFACLGMDMDDPCVISSSYIAVFTSGLTRARRWLNDVVDVDFSLFNSALKSGVFLRSRTCLCLISVILRFNNAVKSPKVACPSDFKNSAILNVGICSSKKYVYLFYTVCALVC